MSDWISVEDKLPSERLWVLWHDGKQTMNPPYIHIDYINHRKEAFVNYLHNYTHWMPLPEPPSK